MTPTPRPGTGRLVLFVLAGVVLGIVLGVSFKELFTAAFTTVLGGALALIGGRK